MSTDRDTTRIVRSWLMTDEHESADRVLDAVLQAVDATPQRRATWWPARRFPDMNTMLKFGVAAVILAAAILLGFNYLAAPNVGSGGLDTAAPAPTPSPQATATVVPLLGSATEPGEYRVSAALPITVIVSLPDGWSGSDNWVALGPDGVEPPAGMAIRFSSVRSVYANPLNELDGFLEPRVGPTVEDLADAMVSHPEWPTTTAIGPVTVDGYEGQHVRLTLPPELELAGRFLLFLDEGGGGHWAFEPGQIFDFYIVDVEGERLVLELISYPDTSDADLAARQAIVDSLQIEP